MNAVTKVGEYEDEAPTGDRTETYTAFDGSGQQVTVTHNYDTGVTSVEAGGGSGEG